MITKTDLQAAERIVYAAMPPTPQFVWPLLCEALGCEIWLKHENHTPTGAFKVRGGLVHMRKRIERGETRGVITATRGNHGQSIPFAARREGVATTVVVPLGNSTEKNAAMRALGAELIETGSDFDAARDAAAQIARQRGLDFIGSFGPGLVLGVATYAGELFGAAGALDRVYVPIGLGSGICGVIGVRDLLGLKTEIFGVVAEKANAYRLSFEAGAVVTTNAALTFADGMAVRVPSPVALDVMMKGLAGVVSVSESDIAAAIRLIYRSTHNVAEGAGAAAVAAAWNDKRAIAGKRIGAILTGGNIDSDKFAAVLSGETPAP